ncbi:hypothetical protein FF36_05319 [Frankia torreyi]|uniref:Uncharacterized protein n=1 Tax=Frankia torreyi TaxID=1856 RepID=A0A0D8B8D1_9ACTN|nr:MULTISPECIES: hypothetical protein [Frankia]KJE20345.1 hypothetical protein FF36_05319 [Frankia torreyi]KQM02751.1 hypothetical protein FF86_105743 [Frankia sp. CpI1-P]
MSGDVRGDLRRLRWYVAIGLGLLAAVVLALRVVGLVVAVVVTTAERVDVAAATAAGIRPLGASTWLLPADMPVPGWTPRGDDDR